MPCSRDNLAYCGSGYRNLIYDVDHLHRASQALAEKEKAQADCKKDDDGKIPFVDCKDKGGYKQADPCNQTCLSEEPEKDDLKVCQMKCVDEADNMSFRTDDDK
jgi:hypothetical protein